MTDADEPALSMTEHRPWPMPDEPWIARQTWRDLALFHWEIDPALLRERIPDGLEIDLFEGKAWLGIVPFKIEGATLRGFPAPSFLCDFPEINLRTYVARDGKPGVWFLSLETSHALAAGAARAFLNLPYRVADIAIGEYAGRIAYRHERGATAFEADYWPARDAASFQPDAFDLWCSERYRLYNQSRAGALYALEVQHPKWPLQRAEAQIHRNTFFGGLPVGEMRPTVLLSKRIDVVFFPIRKLGPAGAGAA